MNLETRIEEALDEIRPFLQKDGGDIDLISVKEHVVKVKFIGVCSTCNISMMTLQGVTAMLKEKVPEIKEVLEG